MKKVELLSPVGDKKSLYQAIHHGADAVYLAGTLYGARKYAANFNKEELIQAIHDCHLYGVKIYITVNTLIYDSEVEEFISYVEFLYRNYVDAVIVQDIGMISLIRKHFPNLEVHASTQLHNHSKEGIMMLKDLGVHRVVLAREMSLDEIKKMDVPIEKEVFVYGALCISYSGCCLFSSMNGGRSGNRGECTQCCRLPYKLINNNQVIETTGNYLLSTKDLNTTSYIKELMASGIDSFKIEGRMKSPIYVGYVTGIYRKLIDLYYSGKKANITKEEMDNLKSIFNREFTKGYLLKEEDITNPLTPNHQGLEIGQVIFINNKYIGIRLIKDIHQEDGIRFKTSNQGMIVNKLYNQKKLLTNSVKAGNICLINKKFSVKVGETVAKTIPQKLIQEMEKYPPKKIDVSYQINALLGQKLSITITDGVHQVTETGDIITPAISAPISQDNIRKCLTKLGNTPFVATKIKMNIDDNIFISLKNINEIRRSVIEKLKILREESSYDIIIKEIDKIENKKEASSHVKNTSKISVLVRNREQLEVCLKMHVDYIYISDYSLYLEYQNLDCIYYRSSRLGTLGKKDNVKRVLIGELGDLKRYQKVSSIISDYYLNVTNHYSVSYLTNKGVKRVTLSVEIDDKEIEKISQKCFNLELIVYGRVEIMMMKHCLLKSNLQTCGSCSNNQNEFYLEDKEKKRYPIVCEECVTHLLDSKVINKISQIKNYQKYGISVFRLELFDEPTKKVEALIKKIRFNLK